MTHKSTNTTWKTDMLGTSRPLPQQNFSNHSNPERQENKFSYIGLCNSIRVNNYRNVSECTKKFKSSQSNHGKLSQSS